MIEQIEIDKYIVDADEFLNKKIEASLKKIVDSIEMCNFECEAGSLTNHIAFLALKKMAGIKQEN